MNSIAGQLAPDYAIEVNDVDYTARVSPRLINLRLTDERRETADQLDISLDDSDGLLALPPRNSVIKCWIGFEGQLVYKGQFTLDEVTHSGPPDIVTLRARSADFKGQFKRRRQQSWHRVTLGDVLTTMAQRSDLIPSTNQELANKFIEHIDQTNESDLNFLTRLGQQYGAVANVKAGRLLFMPAGTGKTSSGLAINPFDLHRSDGDTHTFSQSDREHEYTGVRALVDNTATGQQEEVVAGSTDNPRTLRYTYSDTSVATEAVNGKWRAMQREGSSLNVTLAIGNAELYPETPTKAHGYKSDIDDTPWVIDRLEHNINDNGFTTSIELEAVDTD